MSNSLSHLKRIRNVVSASCLMIGGGLTGALAQSGIVDTGSRALEELERKQAEAYTLVERLEDVSERMLEVLDGEKLLYQASKNSDDLRYYAPWTSLEKYLKINSGNGNDYAIGGGATDKLYTDEKHEKITRNNPRHRVCLAEGLSDAKIPDVGSKFAVLTYFDRDTYGAGMTPTELLAYAVSHSAKPGVVKGLPIGIGVITRKSGGNILFTDVNGNSKNADDTPRYVSACLAKTLHWGSLGDNIDDTRLAIYHSNVRPEQLRFVLPKIRETKFSDEFTPRPTNVQATCESIDANKIVGRPNYSRQIFKQVATDSAGNILTNSEDKPIDDSDETKDAWANLVALSLGSNNMWTLDPLSCRARYTYRTVEEKECSAIVGGEIERVTSRIGVRMIEEMPVKDSSPARYYYKTKADGTKEKPTYVVDTSFTSQAQASLCETHNAIGVDLAEVVVTEVEKEAGADVGVNNPDPDSAPPAGGSLPVRAQCTPRGGDDAEFAKIAYQYVNAGGNPIVKDRSLYPAWSGGQEPDPSDVFAYYLQYAPKFAPLMAMHEAQGMYDKTKQRFVSANLANKPYFWDAVVRRPHGYRKELNNPNNRPLIDDTLLTLWDHGINKGLSGQSSKDGQPTAWNDFRTRIGDKYVDWYDFDKNFQKPDPSISNADFLFIKGLVKQAFGMWADNNMRISGTKHPNVDDIIDPTVGVLRDAADIGICASDYHDMAVMYEIYGQNYVVNAVAKTYGNVNVFSNHPSYGSLWSEFPLLEPPWYPKSHPFYQRHMEILTKAGYTRHTDNEAMIDQIKANFNAKENQELDSANKPGYKVISYDAQCGDWLVAEEYLGANDHTDTTESFGKTFAQKFPGITAMREKALIQTDGADITNSLHKRTSEADVEGGGQYNRDHSKFREGDPREIPYHGLEAVRDDDGNVIEIGHIAYMTAHPVSGLKYRAGKLSHLFGGKKIYVSGIDKKWKRDPSTPCVPKPGHVQQTNVYQ